MIRWKVFSAILITSLVLAKILAFAQQGQHNFTEVKAKAEAGDVVAQINLGVMYEKGYGTTQDYSKAVQ